MMDEEFERIPDDWDAALDVVGKRVTAFVASMTTADLVCGADPGHVAAVYPLVLSRMAGHLLWTIAGADALKYRSQGAFMEALLVATLRGACRGGDRAVNEDGSVFERVGTA